MNLAEVHDLLTLAASCDNRRFDDGTVAAWHAIVHDLDAGDAQGALLQHFATSSDYLMPVHIRTGALAIQRHREYLAREAQATEDAALDAAGHGPRGPVEVADRSADVIDLVRRVTDRIGSGDPDALRRREWVELERRQRRGRRPDAEPNPYYWARQPGGTPPDMPVDEVS